MDHFPLIMARGGFFLVCVFISIVAAYFMVCYLADSLTSHTDYETLNVSPSQKFTGLPAELMLSAITDL